MLIYKTLSTKCSNITTTLLRLIQMKSLNFIIIVIVSAILAGTLVSNDNNVFALNLSKNSSTVSINQDDNNEALVYLKMIILY